MITTTLNRIRANSPCETGWKKLLKHLGGIRGYGGDTPLPLLTILESNGLDDAIWALRAIDDCPEIRLFACDCAEHVLHIYEAEHSDDKRPRQAIEVARRYAAGRATADELRKARDAAWDAVWYAANAVGSADAAESEAEWQTERFKFWFCKPDPQEEE